MQPPSDSVHAPPKEPLESLARCPVPVGVEHGGASVSETATVQFAAWPTTTGAGEHAAVVAVVRFVHSSDAAAAGSPPSWTASSSLSASAAMPSEPAPAPV